MVDYQRNIIGGIFGLHTPEIGVPHEFNKKYNLKSNVHFFCNARSGIHAVFSALKPKTIWYPSYFCPSMLKIPSLLSSKLAFYSIDHNLNIDDTCWVEKVQQGDVVIMIAYFGFPIDKHYSNEIKKRGAFVLEDASQALLSGHVGKHSDYVVFSPRKFIGIPDGGILTYNDGLPEVINPLDGPPLGWWIKSFHAYLLRHQWDIGSCEVNQEDWFNARKLAGSEIPCGFYKISTLSESILYGNAVNWKEIKEKRRSNFKTLLTAFSRQAIFKTLYKYVVPLGFPIRVSASFRNALLNELYNAKIYPPVHWNIAGKVPIGFQNSHRLSMEEITLPCDQRYKQEDMDKIVQTIKNYRHCDH